MTRHPAGPAEPEIKELLGAYALDALEPDERAMVEAHLRTCVRCSVEVARHHEVAGLLANPGGDADGRGGCAGLTFRVTRPPGHPVADQTRWTWRSPDQARSATRMANLVASAAS
jgi:anti-sigma factor RsiW